MSNDEEVASKAWDDILAGHGVIALNADDVAEKNLMPSVALPDDSGNFMYVIEAYHAIHCTVSPEDCFTRSHIDKRSESHSRALRIDGARASMELVATS